MFFIVNVAPSEIVKDEIKSELPHSTEAQNHKEMGRRDGVKIQSSLITLGGQPTNGRTLAAELLLQKSEVCAPRWAPRIRGPTWNRSSQGI